MIYNMMQRELIIDYSADYTRAAVVEDGQLCELHVEAEKADRQTETLYYGRVQAVRPSVHAAFIDIGQELNAFLPLEDGQKLKGGDMMIVQGVAKQTTQSKGLRISTQINLTGQWLVLIPGETGVHISKKVKDTALRAELAEIGKQICPEGCSIIIRTASENVKLELLREEANELYQKWLDANQKAKGMIRPGVLVGPTPLYLRLVRDLAGSLSKIAVNDEGCFLALKQAQREGKIAAETELLYFKESDSLIFDSFNLETQIDKALKKRVWLPCGGYLIIDFTEALTVIDVNSGKMVKGKSVEETALRVNMEAVSEIARQLRLRDVGGIIVIDLIDMQKDANRHAVLDALKKALKKDRMPTSVDGITKLGLLEMTRRRKSEQLRRTLRTTCSVCSGVGEILAPDEVARRALRQARRMAIAGQAGPFLVKLSPEAAKILSIMPQPENCPKIYVQESNRHRERFEILQPGNETIPQEATELPQ